MKKAGTINLLMTLMLTGLASPLYPFDYVVPDTGQDLCYDWDKTFCEQWHMDGPNQVCDSDPYCPNEGEDFYGQDAQYIINPPDLTDNGNGTVTDNLTGLTWEQKTSVTEAQTYTFSNAFSYCDNLSLGGYDDWRMPTRREFSALLNFSRVSPALDIANFPDYTYTTSNEVYYWTTSEYHEDSNQVWKILISFGLIESGSKDGDLSKVRCVRGAAEPQPSYTDNGNGTVTDNLTGLMWEQKTDDGSSRDKDITFTWKDALAYCENLTLGSFSDWRLPNPKELERIVDLGAANPAVDTTYFSDTSNGLYWTGTSCSKCHKRKAFTIDFSDGELYYGNKVKDSAYLENYTRCVRTADDSPTTTTAVSTTTSSEPGNPCAAEEIYGESSVQAGLLRNFRDTVLSKTAEGQALIKLYYRWSPILAQAIREDDQLREEIKLQVDSIVDIAGSR
jgi:hypothetical protein